MTYFNGCAPLVLHFDVNKTIIMADPAKGTSTDSMLNSLLSEAVWGAVVIPGYHHQHRNQGHRGTHTMPTPTPRGLNGRTLLPEDWVLLSPKPSADPPVLIETTRMFEFHEAADSHDGDFVLSCDHVMQRLKESERSKLHNYEIIGTRSCVDSDNSSTYEPDIDPKDIVVITFAEYIENILGLPRKERNALKTRLAMPEGMGNRLATAGASDTGSISCYAELQRLREIMRAPGRPSSGSQANNICSAIDAHTTTYPPADEADKMTQHASIPDEIAYELFPEGYLAMLPAFFALIARLHTLGVDFRIVFRTFGIDIPRVAKEFNMFCSGQHPLSSRYLPEGVKMDGSGGTVDRRLHLPHRSCKIIRGVMPDAYPARSDTANASHSLASMCVAHVSDEETVTTSCGPSALNSILSKWFTPSAPHIPSHIEPATSTTTSTTNSTTAATASGSSAGIGSYASAAVQDDFLWWDRHGESEDSGKLLVVNSHLDAALIHEYFASSTTITTTITATTTAVPSSACHDRVFHAAADTYRFPPLMHRAVQIFFDDNIERDRAHIVDVRRDCCIYGTTTISGVEGAVNTTSAPPTTAPSASFESIPFEESRMRYIARIEPYRAIVDDKYYIDLLRHILRNRGILEILCSQL